MTPFNDLPEGQTHSCDLCNKSAKTMSDLLKVIGNPGQCHGCTAMIWWVHTKTNKPIPLNSDGSTHFSNCPNIRDFRKQKAEKSAQRFKG